MILEDAPSIRAALATMHPAARAATLYLTQKIVQEPHLVGDDEQLFEFGIKCCGLAYQRAGYPVQSETDQQRLYEFVDANCDNVVALALSIVWFEVRRQNRAATWGSLAKIGAFVGAVALGAWFG